MDRRLDGRYEADLDVKVTEVASPERTASGRIVNISESGVCADLALHFAVGAVVKIELGDCQLFGHVTYSTEGQSFRTGIEVVRVLIGQSDLSRLVNAILAETLPATPGVKAITT